MPATWRTYYELTKPGITRMVLITAVFGFLLASKGQVDLVLLVVSLLGIGLASAGSAVLNNWMEVDLDARMHRTRGRALPCGKIDQEVALGFGLVLVLGGVVLLVAFVNQLTALLVLLSAFLYVLVYTPLKRRTWLNTSIGAIPGALPMSCGWVAATGTVDGGAFIAFAILYAWQHPHFYAIAWLHKEDYARAGFKMLSVTDPTGARLFLQVIAFAILLLGIGLLPSFVGMAGWIYGLVALAMGLLVLVDSIRFIRTPTMASARGLLRATIIYLPVLLLGTMVEAAVQWVA